MEKAIGIKIRVKNNAQFTNYRNHTGKVYDLKRFSHYGPGMSSVIVVDDGSKYGLILPIVLVELA